LASRSLHLRIQPRPANISESREIFRLLQRFGEINTYKWLRYEYHNPSANSSLVIYRDADSAQAALNASPIRFALERVVPDADVHKSERGWSDDEIEDEEVIPNRAPDSLDDILKPSTLLNQAEQTPPSSSAESPTPTPTQSQSQSPMPFEDAPIARKVTSKWFQVTVDHSRVIHQDFVERQPLWKYFTPMKSTGQQDLAKVVPHYGLSDVSKRPPNHHRTPNQVLKTMAKYVEHRMPSLKQMYEQS
ncbi:hypothetical protein K504DRAFT_342827, partial [Pleomassaria siparia CBS 279.74]